MHVTSPAQNSPLSSFVRNFLQTFENFMLFLGEYSFQLRSLENTTLMRMAQVYTSTARLGVKLACLTYTCIKGS